MPSDSNIEGLPEKIRHGSDDRSVFFREGVQTLLSPTPAGERQRERVRKVMPTDGATWGQSWQVLQRHLDSVTLAKPPADTVSAFFSLFERVIQDLTQATADGALPLRDARETWAALVHPQAWAVELLAAPDEASIGPLRLRLDEHGLLDPKDRGLATLGIFPVCLPPFAVWSERLQRAFPDATFIASGIAGETWQATGADDDEAHDLATHFHIPGWASKELGDNVCIGFLGKLPETLHPALERQTILRPRVAPTASYIPPADLAQGPRNTFAAGLIVGNGARSDGNAWHGLLPKARLAIAPNGGGRLGHQTTLRSLAWLLDDAKVDILILPRDWWRYEEGDANRPRRNLRAWLPLLARRLQKRGVQLVQSLPRFAAWPAGDAVPPRDVWWVGSRENAQDLPIQAMPTTRLLGPRTHDAGTDLPPFDHEGFYTLMQGDDLAAAVMAGALGLILSAARETHGPDVKATQIRPVWERVMHQVARRRGGQQGHQQYPDIAAIMQAVQSAPLHAAAPADAALESPQQTPRPQATLADTDTALPAATPDTDTLPMPTHAAQPDASTPPADPAPEGSVTALLARKLEDEFLRGFESRCRQLEAVPHPTDKRTYAVNPHTAVETISESQWLRHQLASRPALDVREFPRNQIVVMPVYRTRVFQKPLRRVLLAGACVAPLQDLLDKGHSQTPMTAKAVLKIVDRIPRKPGEHLFLGVYSPTGWTEATRRNLPTVEAGTVFLLDSTFAQGFRFYAPSDLDLSVRKAFDPEDVETKTARLIRLLDTAPELKVAGGFILISELIERANVPQALVTGVVHAYVRERKELQFLAVDATPLIRRPRF